jgi:hypothetical protein
MGGCLLTLRLRQAPNGSRKGAKKKKRREGVAFAALSPAAPGSFQAQRMNTRLRRHNPLRLSFFLRLCVHNLSQPGFDKLSLSGVFDPIAVCPEEVLKPQAEAPSRRTA